MHCDKLTSRVYPAQIRLFKMTTVPDFYLAAPGECTLLAEPRACWALQRFADAVRDDYLLVKIDPPIIGQYFGLGDKDADVLLLSTRYQGATLFPINEWPSHVYVTRIVDPSILSSEIFHPDQVEYIARATLYRTLEDAKMGG